MEIRHYIQDWKSYKRVIIVSDKGSVFVELYDQYLCYNIKAQIWGLFVEESFRNKGVGKQLIQYAENVIKQFGEQRIAIIWDNSTPSWIMDWYKKSGYKFIQDLNDTDFLLVKEL